MIHLLRIYCENEHLLAEMIYDAATYTAAQVRSILQDKFQIEEGHCVVCRSRKPHFVEVATDSADLRQVTSERIPICARQRQKYQFMAARN